MSSVDMSKQDDREFLPLPEQVPCPIHKRREFGDECVMTWFRLSEHVYRTRRLTLKLFMPYFQRNETFPDVSCKPREFEVFANFMKSGKLVQRPGEDFWHFCSDVWELADRLDLPHLKDAVVDKIQAGLADDEQLSKDSRRFFDLVKLSKAGSGLRKFLTELGASQLGPGRFEILAHA